MQLPRRLVQESDAFLDTMNRGLLDLVLVNDQVYSQVDSTKLGTNYREPKLLYLNRGDGTFQDVSVQAAPALSVPQVSRGLAAGDLFNNGIPNIVVET